MEDLNKAILEKNIFFQYKYYIDALSEKELIDFGIDLLEKGITTDSVCILAGLSENERMEDILKYYEAVLDEFGISFDITKKENSIEEFGESCLYKYISGFLSEKEVRNILIKINSSTSYTTALSLFDRIEEDVSLINEGYKPLFNWELIDMDESTFFLEYSKLFLEINRNGKISELDKICYCKKCKKITELIYIKPIFERYQKRVCSRCKNEEYDTCTTLNGMKMFRKIRLTTAST